MQEEDYEIRKLRKLLQMKEDYLAGKYKEEPSETVIIVPPEGHGPDDWINDKGNEEGTIPEGPLDMYAFRSLTLQQRLAYARKNAIEGIDVIVCVACQGEGGGDGFPCEFCQGLGVIWGRHDS